MTGTNATHWGKALELQNHGQALAAVRELRELGQRLVRQRQDLAGILETARQLFGLYDHGTALNLLEASVRLAGKQPALLVRLAMLLVTEGRYAEAARFAREALAQGKSQSAVAVDARLLLAECLERTGHSDEAASLTEEVLKTNHLHPRPPAEGGPAPPPRETAGGAGGAAGPAEKRRPAALGNLPRVV